jgi:arginine repressor
MTQEESVQEREFLEHQVRLSLVVKLPFGKAGEVTDWLKERGFQVTQAHVDEL